MVSKVINEITSGFVDELMYSSNGKGENIDFGKAVKGRVDATCQKIESTIDSVIDLGTKVFDIGKEIYEEARGLDLSNLTAKDIYNFPRCLENILGDTYESQIDASELVDDAQVQEIGQKIIEQSDRKDLNFKILINKNEGVNAKVIPGGRIIITEGMLNKLREETDDAGYEKKLARVIGYLVARASASQETKKAKLSGLLSVVRKIFSAAMKIFFPVKTITVKGQRKVDAEDKKKFAYTTIAELGLSIGSKVLLHKQDESADQAARTLGLSYLEAAEYASSKDDFDDTLDQLFEPENPEAYKDDLAGDVGKMERQVVEIIA